MTSIILASDTCDTKCTYLLHTERHALNQYDHVLPYFVGDYYASTGNRTSLLKCKLTHISLTIMVLSLTLTLLLFLYSCTMCTAGSCKKYSNRMEFMRIVNYMSPFDYKPYLGIHLPTVHIAVVACNERVEEPLNMVKSAVILGQAPLHVHIFTEENLRERFEKRLQLWFDAINELKPFSYSLHPIQFPRGNEEGWKKLFKPCACQRLFIPDILVNTDSVLYVDTDILFMRPPEHVWGHLRKFNSTQLAALAPESEDRSANWYVRFARHPFYPPYGLNTGVMLMNLTRMRSFGWGENMQPLYDKYRRNTTWGDQDIINILLQKHPELVYTYGCEWNYRPDHCMYMQNCRAAETKGVYVLHGSRGWFHNDEKQPVFKAIYQTYLNYTFGSDLKINLLQPLIVNMKKHARTQCGYVNHIFSKGLAKFIK